MLQVPPVHPEHSRAGKKAEALKMLQEAIVLDAKLALRAAVDPDFEALREDAEFKKVLGKFSM